MADDDKTHLEQLGADQILVTDPCPSTGKRHGVAMKNGHPVAGLHMDEVQEGESMVDGHDYYWVDRRTGRLTGAMRMGKGPAKVTTDAYREGWDTIFGNNERGEA